MPRAWKKRRESAVTVDTVIGTTVETVVATLSGISTPTPDAEVQLDGWAIIATGTGTTAVTLTVRRGTDATGTIVGEANAQTAAAGNQVGQSISVVDRPGEVANQSYVLTATRTGGTGNGTGLAAALAATY